MTSDEALMILFASYNYNGNYQELIEAREKLEKDLELLDTIKCLIKKGDIVVNPDLFVDYPELYEWLEENE